MKRKLCAVAALCACACVAANAESAISAAWQSLWDRCNGANGLSSAAVSVACAPLQASADVPIRTKAVARLIQGDALMRESNLDRAMDEFEAAIRQDSRLALGYHHRGVVWNLRGDARRALADFETAVRLDPDSWVVLLARAATYASLGRVDDSVADYTRLLDQYRHADASLRAQFLMARSHQLALKGNLPAAMKDAQETVKLDPRNAGAHNNVGVIYEKLGSFDRALAAYSSSVELNPRAQDALLNRGELSNRQGLHEAALADFSRVLSENPTSIQAQLGRAFAWIKLGDLRLARSELEAVLRQDPGNAQALSYLHMAQRDPSRQRTNVRI